MNDGNNAAKDQGAVRTVEGIVEEALPNITFRVNLGNNNVMLAYLSGKMRLNRIKVLPGDRVLVEINSYDSKRGRITRRL